MSTMVRGQTQEKKGQRYSGPFVNDIRHRLDSYFDVMIRNVRDLVPKAIGFYLVRSVGDKMQFELLNALNSDQKISELLGEPPHILEERKQLRQQQQTLQKAHGVLTRDPALAAVAFEAEIEEEGFRDRASSVAASAVSGVGNMLSKAKSGIASAATATASAASNATAGLRGNVSSAGTAPPSSGMTSEQRMNQAAQSAMTAAASNPAVQKAAVSAAVSAAQNP